MNSNKFTAKLVTLLLTCTFAAPLNASVGNLARQTPPATFSVATLNVDGLPGRIAFFDVNTEGPQVAGSLRISQYLAQKSCDILCLQENFNYSVEVSSRLLLGYQRDEWSGGIYLVGQGIDYAHLHNFKYQCDGLNTMWKRSITSGDYVRTPWERSFGKFSHDFDDIITKGFRRHELTLADGHQVVVYNMHMDASSQRDQLKQNDGPDRAARLAQWQQLAADIVARLDNRPVIVAGDMNSFYRRDDVKGAFVDAIESTGLATVGDAWVTTKLGGTFPALGSEPLDDEVLDKILYVNPVGGQAIVPLDVELDREGYVVDGTPLGDHFPLIATFMFEGDDTDIVETYSDYVLQKISNPDRGQGEVDGLMPGGDRQNSYTWRLAMLGDEIYVATSRNVANALVNTYATQFAAAGISTEAFWALIDAVTNGDIPRESSETGANIVAYNRKTGEFRIVYTAEKGVNFRMAVTFGDNVYFGSYAASPTMPQYILKLDSEGNITKVFQTTGSVSLRANCVYDDHLFFAGADEREEIDPSSTDVPTKMAVLRKSNDDDTLWERVADYRDFGEVAYDPIMSSWAGCPFWEMATHEGYIYATAPSTRGFVIFKGHPAADGEPANEYGWYWQEVAGVNNGINNPGLSDVEGGEPGTLRSLIGSVYEFNGELYAYNFDHAFGGEAAAFAGFLQQLAGQDVKASDYLSPLYNSLQNPQKVWRLDDATGKFVECRNFTKLLEGTTNEYIWRMGTYDNQLYISTMDAGIFYGYLTQLTNGSFFNMSTEERLSKIGYINTVIQMLLEEKGTEFADRLTQNLEMVKMLLDIYSEEAKATLQSINSLSDLLAYLTGVTAQIEELLADEEASASLAETIAAALENLREKATELVAKIDLEGINMYLAINQAVMNDEWGFDLFRTYDAEKFEVITRSGFDDKYNYGCPAFLATPEGLYIGTCNPFYGGQLYLLTNDGTKDDPTTAVTTAETSVTATPTWYSLDGRRLSSQPARKGIYIVGGQKMVVE